MYPGVTSGLFPESFLTYVTQVPTVAGPDSEKSDKWSPIHRPLRGPFSRRITETTDTQTYTNTCTHVCT